MDFPAWVFRLLSDIYRIYFRKDQVIIQSKRVVHWKTIKRRITLYVNKFKQLTLFSFFLHTPGEVLFVIFGTRTYMS